jgi:hypothetical protein
MRCYYLSASIDANTKVIQKYVGTQAEVRQTKEEWANIHRLKKTFIDAVEIEVPMEKAKLIGFINDILEKNS